MRVRVRDKVWQLDHVKHIPGDDPDTVVDGDCDSPTTKNKKIRIVKDLSEQRLLDAYVHELTHAALWDLGEGPVASLANAVAHELWNDGLRPGHRPSKKNFAKLEHEVVSVIWSRGEVAVFDESVRQEVAHTIARLLNRLGWAFK
ncbi:MAG: hypothetical protein AB7L09_01170 [Nitrospira sp.]